MKKNVITIVVSIVAILGIIAVLTIGSYNGLVSGREKVEKSWSDVSVYLQRRADLIPNLVNSVKGYTEYEQNTLTAVTEARNSFQNATDTNEQVEAAAQFASALDIWVNAVTEAYPELKSSEQFNALNDELTGSENRIATARKDYNDTASEYNAKIRKFPRNIIAGMFGFESYEYFEAQSGAENVPQVSFD